MQTAVGHLLGPDQGEVVRLLALGVRFMIAGETTGGAFSLVEHPLPPRALGRRSTSTATRTSTPTCWKVASASSSAPKSSRPDQAISSSSLGASPHAFWNAGDQPARLLELISPAGFEHYFRELAPLLATPERDQAAIGEIVTCYNLDIDFSTIPTLAERHNLRLG